MTLPSKGIFPQSWGRPWEGSQRHLRAWDAGIWFPSKAVPPELVAGPTQPSHGGGGGGGDPGYPWPSSPLYPSRGSWRYTAKRRASVSQRRPLLAGRCLHSHEAQTQGQAQEETRMGKLGKVFLQSALDPVRTQSCRQLPLPQLCPQAPGGGVWVPRRQGDPAGEGREGAGRGPPRSRGGGGDAGGGRRGRRRRGAGVRLALAFGVLAPEENGKLLSEKRISFVKGFLHTRALSPRESLTFPILQVQRWAVCCYF